MPEQIRALSLGGSEEPTYVYADPSVYSTSSSTTDGAVSFPAVGSRKAGLQRKHEDLACAVLGAIAPHGDHLKEAL